MWLACFFLVNDCLVIITFVCNFVYLHGACFLLYANIASRPSEKTFASFACFCVSSDTVFMHSIPVRYPDEFAWQLDMDRKFIRQCEPLKKLHNFLVEETESVRISSSLSLLCWSGLQMFSS